jgi:Ran GTPase-activating protein (RanGAP) involved in mRNA processing and transport
MMASKMMMEVLDDSVVVVDVVPNDNDSNKNVVVVAVEGEKREDRDVIQVLESLEAIQACLGENVHRHLSFVPKAPDQTSMGDEHAEMLARAMEGNTAMKSLTLEEVHLETLHSIHRVGDVVRQHENLKRLALLDNRLGNEGVGALMQVLLGVSSHHPHPPDSSSSNNNNNNSIHCYQPQHHHHPRLPPTSFSSSLQAIRLCGNLIGDQGAYWIAQSLMHQPNNCVTELDLSSNEITEQGAVCLADMLGRSHISAFLLNGNQAGVKGALAIARAMQTNRRLNVLGLCGNAIGDEGAAQIAHVAKTHPRIKAMLLEDNVLGERGIMAVADAHQNNSRLGMMEVSYNFISAASMRVLSASIQNIVYLYLDHCEIGDAHLEILANGLRFNTSIRDLFLEGNHIGVRGSKCLARAMQQNDVLEGVFLDGNRLTRKGALLLRDVLKIKNMSLRRLQIHDEYHDIQLEIDVYLDMNGAGRKTVLQSSFPASLWSHFLVQRNVLFDADLMFLFLKERPDLSSFNNNA